MRDEADEIPFVLGTVKGLFNRLTGEHVEIKVVVIYEDGYLIGEEVADDDVYSLLEAIRHERMLKEYPSFGF